MCNGVLIITVFDVWVSVVDVVSVVVELVGVGVLWLMLGGGIEEVECYSYVSFESSQRVQRHPRTPHLWHWGQCPGSSSS